MVVVVRQNMPPWKNETLKQEVCVSESHDNILFNHDTDTYLNTYFESNNIQKKRRKCDESCSKMTKNSNKKSLSRGEVRYEENIRSVIRDYCVCCEKMLFFRAGKDRQHSEIGQSFSSRLEHLSSKIIAVSALCVCHHCQEIVFHLHVNSIIFSLAMYQIV